MPSDTKEFYFLEFKKLTLECIETIRPYFLENEYRLCDFSLGGILLWRDYHKTEFALEDGALYIKVNYPTIAFTPPRNGEHKKESYERIKEYCADIGAKPLLIVVAEELLQDILKMYPNAKTGMHRDWSDYLYNSEEITSLAGRKYSGQRNHINRFLREHEAWSFEPITEANASAVRSFIEKYAQEHIKESPTYIEGNRKAIEVLDNMSVYNQLGGVLYVGGEVVGASLGETVGDTLYIHTEKADTAYHGAYPMLVNRFAGMYVTEGINYINREEDDGDEGLRTSKLSYHPVKLLNKYRVEL